MKSKPEFRAVFSSASMFYRALHVISTQKYRSPVRRYILELFDLVLDSDLVTVLVECTSKLQLPPATPASSPTARSRPARPMNPRVFSVIGRKRRTDDSDEDDESDGDGFEKVLPERPVMRLRPMSRIVGFPG
jgi:rapamycin-insensitive companion of mTOR